MRDKIFDSDFFKKLENIAISTRMIMSEGASGGRKSKAKGTSVEFSDFREYTMGDDFRRIDWNAYGRFGKLFVKLFMEEREALVNIFIDCSKSMDYGEPKKSELAVKLSAVMSYLAMNNLDRVCINAALENTLNSSSVLGGRAMFERGIGFLQSLNFSGKTNLLSHIRRKEFHQRGVSIIFSDFFTEGLEETLKYLLYKKQETFLIQILSPGELKPELNGQLRLIDSETQEIKNITVTPSLMKKYNRQMEEFTGGIKELCSRFGASYIQVSSEENLEKIVFEKFTASGIIT